MKNNSDKTVSGVSADIISRIYSQTAARLKNKKHVEKTGTEKKLKLIQKKDKDDNMIFKKNE